MRVYKWKRGYSLLAFGIGCAWKIGKKKRGRKSVLDLRVSTQSAPYFVASVFILQSSSILQQPPTARQTLTLSMSRKVRVPDIRQVFALKSVLS